MSAFAIRPAPQPLYLADDDLGPKWRSEIVLARTREYLACVVRAQDPDRHFRGLPESPEVIEAYDAVRAAEAEVARVEREGRAA